MIECRDLSFNYSRQKRSLLDQANLHLTRRGIYGLIGPNGAGKTTFFDLLMNHLRPVRGEIVLGAGEGQRVLMPQAITAPHVLTCAEIRNLIFGLNANEPKRLQESFEELLSPQERDRFHEIRNRRFGLCSGGERAWLICALTLTLDRELYLLDEPTVGVDPEFRILIWKRIIQRAAAGKTIVVSSHSLDEIGGYVDSLVLLLAGRFTGFPSIQAFKDAYAANSADEAFQKALSKAGSSRLMV